MALSYRATQDELYVSEAGYWDTNAHNVIPNVGYSDWRKAGLDSEAGTVEHNTGDYLFL